MQTLHGSGGTTLFKISVLSVYFLVPYIQVYPEGIRHIRADKRVNEWKAPGKKLIVKCAVNQRQVRCSLRICGKLWDHFLAALQYVHKFLSKCYAFLVIGVYDDMSIAVYTIIFFWLFYIFTTCLVKLIIFRLLGDHFFLFGY